jgi:hypothetical protein
MDPHSHSYLTNKKETKKETKKDKVVVCGHTLCVALPIYIKKVILLRQKKNHGNSNIFTMQKLYIPNLHKMFFIKKKSSKRNQNPSRYIYIL